MMIPILSMLLMTLSSAWAVDAKPKVSVDAAWILADTPVCKKAVASFDCGGKEKLSRGALVKILSKEGAMSKYECADPQGCWMDSTKWIYAAQANKAVVMNPKITIYKEKLGQKSPSLKEKIPVASLVFSEMGATQDGCKVYFLGERKEPIEGWVYCYFLSDAEENIEYAKVMREITAKIDDGHWGDAMALIQENRQISPFKWDMLNELKRIGATMREEMAQTENCAETLCDRELEELPLTSYYTIAQSTLCDLRSEMIEASAECYDDHKKLHRGSKVTVVERRGKWAKIANCSDTCWLYQSELISIKEAARAAILKNNIKEYGDTGTGSISNLTAGTFVFLLRRDGNRCRIAADSNRDTWGDCDAVSADASPATTAWAILKARAWAENEDYEIASSTLDSFPSGKGALFSDLIASEKKAVAKSKAAYEKMIADPDYQSCSESPNIWDGE